MKYEKYRREIDYYIQQHRMDFYRDVAELILKRTTTNNRPVVENALRDFLARSKKYGFDVRTEAHGEVGVIEMGEGEQTLGILAHIDIVPPGDAAAWRNGLPFVMQYLREEGIVIGRGVVDNKGPMVSVLYAMRAVKSLNLPFRHKVQFIVGSREEGTWSDIDLFRATCKLPDYGFTPDGKFPIGNVENGYCDVSLMTPLTPISPDLEYDLEIVDVQCGLSEGTIPPQLNLYVRGEKSYIDQALSESFEVGNSPEKVEVILQEDGIYHMCFHGKAAHSSVPETGENPIWSMSRFLKSARLADNGAQILFPFVIEQIEGFHYGESFELHRENPCCGSQPAEPTKMSMTVLRKTNDRFLANLNIRQGHHVQKQHVYAALRRFSTEYGFDYVVTEWLDPLAVDKDLPFVKTMARIYSEVMGEEECFCAGAGTSYAKALPNMVSFGPLFPKEPDTCHEVNEFIQTDALLDAAMLYAYYITEMAVEEG